MCDVTHLGDGFHLGPCISMRRRVRERQSDGRSIKASFFISIILPSLPALRFYISVFATQKKHPFSHIIFATIKMENLINLAIYHIDIY